MKMSRIVRCILLLVLMVAGGSVSQAQQVIYVSVADGWDGWNSGVVGQPYKTIEKGIEQAIAINAKEVRVAVGEYNLSKELVIPAALSLVGGYLSKKETKVQNPAEQTILVGNSLNRVATVAGVMDGFTVKKGYCKGGNGGGIYVKSAGSVKNCIITDNKATFLLPKVGDLLMDDGTFMSVDNFTYDLRGKVKGMIFWVNPDKSAGVGSQGYAVAANSKYISKWSNGAGKTGTYRNEVFDAVKDMGGKANTDALFRYADCNAVRESRNKGAEWSLPALGQLMQMAVEWSLLEASFKKMWQTMRANPATTRNDLIALFGGEIDTGATVWDLSGHFIISQGYMLSSTLQSNRNVWVLANLYQDAKIEPASQTDGGTLVYVTEF